jgi:hypothetical protein
MPSSHASVLAYLAAFVALWAASADRGSARPPASLVNAQWLASSPPPLSWLLPAALTAPGSPLVRTLGVVCLPVAAACLALLRVVLGFHSLAQVLAGLAFGAACAAAWWAAGAAFVWSALAASDALRWALFSVAACAALAFAAVNSERWWAELRATRRATAAMTAGGSSSGAASIGGGGTVEMSSRSL